MKSRSCYLMIVIVFLLTSCDQPARKRVQLEQLSRDAYTFGFPLVLMDTSRKYAVAISKSSLQKSKVPMYQFFHNHKVRESQFNDLASLDNDMIYSTAWLDLAKDPVVLTVPYSGKRFFVGGFLQGWSEVFGVVGTRATGNKSQRFLISGPQWKGKTPAGMKPLRASTNLVWLPIRILASEKGKEQVSTRSLQNGLSLVPLSRWQKNKGSSLQMVDVDQNMDLRRTPRDLVFAMSADEYFTKLCTLLVDNPPGPMDAAFVDQLRKLGIVARRDFKFADLPADAQRALNESVKGAKHHILAHQSSFSPVGRLVNGWIVSLAEGTFGTDYSRRAFQAYQGIGTLPPQDGVFPVAYEDNRGQQLMGENSYEITFAKDQLPPVNGFWSVTMYQLPDVKLVASDFRRYSLGQNNRLKMNPNGSLTIYLQPTSPGPDKESNWLPSGKGNYQVTLKLYWPKNEVLEGRWFPPQVVRTQESRLTMQ